MGRPQLAIRHHETPATVSIMSSHAINARVNPKLEKLWSECVEVATGRGGQEIQEAELRSKFASAVSSSVLTASRRAYRQWCMWSPHESLIALPFLRPVPVKGSGQKSQLHRPRATRRMISIRGRVDMQPCDAGRGVWKRRHQKTLAAKVLSPPSLRESRTRYHQS